MDKFNWTQLKNDSRLSNAQKKTVNKILLSLQVPARDNFRNRPAITFNATGMGIPEVNKRLRELVNAKRKSQAFSSNNSWPSGFSATSVRNNPLRNTSYQRNVASARQHREAFGN